MNKICLIIVDGFGIGPNNKGNAILQADTPNWDGLLESYPNVNLKASGNHVGLPDGIMGNSEVGHLTIGSGRIIFQSLERINQSIKSDELKHKKPIIKIIDHLKKTNGSLHLMGLLSDGMVHSSQEHLHHLIDIFHKDVSKIWIHAFTDGRDTPVDSSPKYILDLQQHIDDKDNVKLASIIGRYYAMDRDNKWERTKIAYDMLVQRKGELTENVIETVKSRYADGETDEFLKPIITTNSGSIEDGDAVLFFNFRPDRARQITRALNFEVEFSTIKFENLYFVSMTDYDDDWNLPVIFESKIVKKTLSEVVSLNNYWQLHVAETEKYAHVTYFLNGGVEDPFPREDRILIPSLKIATYDLQPEMSTPKITEETISSIKTGKYDFVVVNIACPDMVGHTGNLQATVKAVNALDQAFGDIYKACKSNKYDLIITADHGNAEKMLENGSIHTAHTTNDVPFLITKDVKLKQNRGLKDVAPTVLDLLDLPIPEEMSGENLIIK